MIELNLNLKRKWFDMIRSGEKKEEYRDISPYWCRIFSSNIKIKNKFYDHTDIVICFSNGYQKNREQIKIKCEGLVVREGKIEWGAEIGKQYFTLLLGEIIIS